MKMVERMKKSKIGRIICRLFGEERGAIMMEYVIVAVLIAAAAVAAVAYFGKDIVAMFGVAGAAARGDSQGAITARGTAKTAGTKNAKNAATENSKFSDLSEGDQGQGNGQSAGQGGN